jgi:L,D-transpeptidase ErfK/SrfK
MHRIVDPSRLSVLFRLAALCLLIVSLNGCAAMRGYEESSWLSPGRPDTEIERNEFPVKKGDDVVGRLAVVRLEKGDTLPDIARHFSLGATAISAANPGVDIWVPKTGERILLPLSFILPDAPRKGIVVNLATMRLFAFRGDGTSLTVTTYPVGVGTEERPTPRGQARVVRKTARPTWNVPASIAADHRKKGDILPAKIPPGPDNPLGDYALYLSFPSYLIHGTNKPASVGLKATNGCMRLYPENIEPLFRDTPVNTPVLIVNQPYLVGERDGVLYLEVHTPLEDSGAAELAKMYEKLRSIEKNAARPFDWQKVRKVQAEARGIPVPIFAMRPESETMAEEPVKVEHPDSLYGRPEVPELRLDAWYLLAADLRDEIDAKRLAAIINHQGPPIPARVIAKDNGFRVIAGPFKDSAAARDAAKRLKYDLDMDCIVIDPVEKG